MSQKRPAIRAIASHLPEIAVTNDQLAGEWGSEWPAAKILAKTGIAVRYQAADGECASDLAVKAALKLIENGACTAGEIDFLLLCTQTPDYILPPTACLLQDRLGLKTSCGALDINLGCSGFLYGLAMAKSLVASSTCRNVLLITADTYTKLVNRRDRSVRTLFGDGAAATLISAVDVDCEPIGPFVFGTDGKGARHLMVPAGGMRTPITPEAVVEKDVEGGNRRSASNLFMNGAEIFNFTLRAVPEAVREILAKSGMTMQDVDYFVFHQASKVMLDHLRAKLGIPENKFCLDLENGGNTVSTTIPLALERAKASGRVKVGDRVMLVGFGVGLSWAATIITIT